MRSGWQPTRALPAAAVTVAVLVFGAVALHRPDFLVLAAPLAAGLALGVPRMPRGTIRARLRATATTAYERQGLDLVLRVDAPPDADLVASTVYAGRWLAEASHVARAALPDAGPRIDESAAIRWGRTDAGRAYVTASAAQGLFRCDTSARGGSVTVLPWRERFDAVDVLPHASGTIGAHRSYRPGTSSELDSVRPFVAGDRLRRINWRVSLRTDALHVTSTLSERDTTVLLVLDSSIDVGAGVELAPGGSLDVAVHAAAAVAEHYLRCGDRVGFVDHARVLRPIRPMAGRAHLDRIVDALLDVRPEPAVAARALTNTARRLAPRATVMLFSPLIGAASPERAAELAATGASVLVVDTLDDRLPTIDDNRWNDLAWRLLLLERRGEIARLATRGVPVVPWRGEGSLDAVLLALSRAASMPRLR